MHLLSTTAQDCRIAHGIDAVIADSASLQVMVERIGCLNPRWRLIKRKNFIQDQERIHGPDRNVFAVPSLPSASATSTGGLSLTSSSESTTSGGSSTGSDDGRQKKEERKLQPGQIIPPPSAGLAGRDTSAENAAATGKRTGVVSSGSDSEPDMKRQRFNFPANVAKSGGIKHSVVANIAKSGGIKHNIRTNDAPGAPTLKSSSSLSKRPKRETIILGGAPGMPLGPSEIGVYYAINEDDMIMVEGVMMCPFVLRSKNAVYCGALADTIMPGMLRAQFSQDNKLLSLEMIYDAMGFMQQLDRANGGEVTAQIIPGSLEMALMHSPNEARVITEATPPYNIVHINEAWTKLMKFSQVEVEGMPLSQLIYGPHTDPRLSERADKPKHDFAQVAIGRSACSTNLHYDKEGSAFVDFMSSYPLYSANDKVTHILHTHIELPQDQRLVSSS
jgi:PAS domain-containing protein